MASRVLWVIAVGVLSACSALEPTSRFDEAQLEEAAELTAVQGTLWGVLSGSTATPVVLEVNGNGHWPYSQQLKLDDALYLGPGPHSLGILVAGYPHGPALEGLDGSICLHMVAEARARYVLKARVEAGNFRLDLIKREGETQTALASLPVEVRDHVKEPICPSEGNASSL